MISVGNLSDSSEGLWCVETNDSKAFRLFHSRE
jgi:hypothetical protein